LAAGVTGPPPSRLVGLLSHAFRTVPYYQGHISGEAITPNNALNVLDRLPLLTREQVRAQKPRLWSTAGDPYEWRTVRTSGTTGIPIEVALDQATEEAEIVSLARQIDMCSTGDWRDCSIMYLTLHLAASSRAMPAPWSAQSRLVKWNLSRLWQLPDEHFIECLKEIDGQIVTMMPSVAAVLLDRVGRPGRVLPRLLVLSGENADDDLRARLSAVFGCATTCLYTLAEAGIAANGCLATRNYHVNEADVFLELVDAAGRAVSPGALGDVVITPLANRAMPLLRYLTGDRGAWLDGDCGCPQRGRLFRLETARSRTVAAEGPTGRQITDLNVAKLFASMNVDSVRLSQRGPKVIVEYRASSQLGNAQATMIASAVRGLLGPDASVEVNRVTDARHMTRLPENKIVPGVIPPIPLEPREIADWARPWLADDPRIIAAVITGSCLDPGAISRFSDIDMTILVDDHPDKARWRDLAVAMHRHLTGLRINVSNAPALTEAPMVTCRLLAERYPILGDLEQNGVTWPSTDDLSREAVFWAQGARAVLWTRLTAADRAQPDPLREAWLAAKYAVNGLRYHFLRQGGRITQAPEVLRMGLQQVAGVSEILAAFEVACEHRPPPVARSGAPDQYLIDALSVIERIHGR
jgi:phenylacetate-coenzyme A ligase PaaK-like adenylate-forming protein